MTSFYNFMKEANNLIASIESQFESRTKTNQRKSKENYKDAKICHKIENSIIYLTLITNEEVHTISIPIPYIKDGITFIETNGVKRAICNYFNKEEDRVITYFEVMRKIFFDDFNEYVETAKKGKAIYIQKLVYAIVFNNNLSTIIYNLQKSINEIVNRMPLHETAMNSWVLNNRLMIVDSKFNEIIDPEEGLNYQVNKNNEYFDRGWTSVGLSDNALVAQNYILTKDIRKYTVFGIKHHNPQRNLYSTLGMKGDELPILRSKSGHKLISKSIKRKGWNFFTAFVDIPDNFEDQIMVNKIHENKFIINEKRLQLFGELLIKKDDELKYDTPLVKCTDGEIEKYKINADKSWVHKISESITTIGGQKKKVFNVTVKIKKKFKDGTKITNTHANKGVIRMKDLGYAIDPESGEKVTIDIIAPAKSIQKRKNYGQLLEAIINTLNDKSPKAVEQILKGSVKKFPVDKTNSTWITTNNRWGSNGIGVNTNIKKIRTKETNSIIPIVFSDEFEIANEQLDALKNKLINYGFNKDLTWECKTYAGDVKAVCGKVFWGVSKEPEDQLWDKDATIRLNGKDVRTAGLKFSTVEFKALETTFGEDNPIMEEILSYAQGIDSIKEQVKILNSKFGILPKNLKTKSIFDFKLIDQSSGHMFTKDILKGTFGDEYNFPNGVIIKLPVLYQTAVGNKPENNHEGPPVIYEDSYNPEDYKGIYLTDKIYIPSGLLRRSWRHSIGTYGMSRITTLLNSILVMSTNYLEAPNDSNRISMLYRAIGQYFGEVNHSLGSKAGDINTYSMSVRYPYSAKAVATLNNELPTNTIQIHRDMAKILNVNNDDIVLTERFPCLGFMGIRLQKVHITDNPIRKYTIGVSGNSLVSQNLDFDGDVLYCASFHSKEAKELMRKEWENPNKVCWKYIDQLNNRKGSPKISCLGFDDYKIDSFPLMTKEKQKEIVNELAGAKAQTGPMIAFTYNLMRIMENLDQKLTAQDKADIEMFMEKAGQSVFEQKHGDQSLHSIVIDAICTGDVETLAKVEFNPKTAQFICDSVRNKAIKLGVTNLKEYHEKVKTSGGSKIINRIVKSENRIYFASRSLLDGFSLLEHLNSEVVDLPSKIFKFTTSGKYNVEKTIMDEQIEHNMLKEVKNKKLKELCNNFFSFINNSMTKTILNQEKKE